MCTNNYCKLKARLILIVSVMVHLGNEVANLTRKSGLRHVCDVLPTRSVYSKTRAQREAHERKQWREADRRG